MTAGDARMGPTPTRLRCEHLLEPLAVDALAPRLCWQLATTGAGDADVPAEFRVRVASSAAELAAGGADVWDSGWRPHAAPGEVDLVGAALAPRTRYHWSVAVRAASGSTCEGPASHFGTGKLDEPWTGRWIAAPRVAVQPASSEAGFAGRSWAWPAEGSDASAAHLTARFALAPAVDPRAANARLLLGVLGPYALALNGRVVDCGTYWRTPSFVDLRPFLKAGENELSLDVPRFTEPGSYVGPAGVVGALFVALGDGAGWQHDLAELWDDTSVLGRYGDEPWGRFRDVTPPQPPTVLRRSFELPNRAGSTPARAGRPAGRLYISALGLYLAKVNGRPVGAARLAPGWTDYRQRTLYQAYDVSALLEPGVNDIEVTLADGWYAGNVACVGRSVYGERPALCCELHVELDDGESAVVASDESWRAAGSSVRAADLIKGEWLDLRAAPSDMGAVELVAGPPLSAQAAPAVSVRAEVAPVNVRAVAGARFGEQLVDFGRNLAGVVRLELPETAAATIGLRHAEMLDSDGRLYTDSLRGATQLDLVSLPAAGSGSSTHARSFEPRFTVHGFRYVEVAGYPGAVDPAKVRALEFGSEFETTGEFRCSDELLNRLYQTAVATMRSNYGVIPTDCPNRDERMGWLDVHALAPSAMFAFDLVAYFRAWLASLRDAQYADGVLPHVVPDVLAGGGGEAGWADCAVILPWLVYRRYGDERLLSENYPMMRAWVGYLERETARPGGRGRFIRPVTGFGDWLAIGEETPKDLIGTAYFARSAALMADAAEVLGEGRDVERYRTLATAVTAAFNEAFLTTDGRIGSDTQTGYVLALDFDLLTPAARQAAADRLAGLIRERGTLATGYMGVPRLLNVLTRFGHLELAAEIATSRTFPSWGYMLDHGATTLWERWDSWRPEAGFADPAMNSFNHPSLCAVVEWLFSGLGGLEGTEPGFRAATFTPRPVAGVNECEVAYHSQTGRYLGSWRLTGGELTVGAEVPLGGELLVTLPGRERVKAGPGSHAWRVPWRQPTREEVAR